MSKYSLTEKIRLAAYMAKIKNRPGKMVPAEYDKLPDNLKTPGTTLLAVHRCAETSIPTLWEAVPPELLTDIIIKKMFWRSCMDGALWCYHKLTEEQKTPGVVDAMNEKLLLWLFSSKNMQFSSILSKRMPDYFQNIPIELITPSVAVLAIEICYHDRIMSLYKIIPQEIRLHPQVRKAMQAQLLLFIYYAVLAFREIEKVEMASLSELPEELITMDFVAELVRQAANDKIMPVFKLIPLEMRTSEIAKIALERCEEEEVEELYGLVPPEGRSKKLESLVLSRSVAEDY